MCVRTRVCDLQAADEVNLKGVGQKKVSELIDYFKQLTKEFK